MDHMTDKQLAEFGQGAIEEIEKGSGMMSSKARKAFRSLILRVGRLKKK